MCTTGSPCKRRSTADPGLTRDPPTFRIHSSKLHRAGPPLGLSRDLLIRALANQLQERSYGGVSRALRRRLRSLAGASDKAQASPLGADRRRRG